MLPDAFYFSFLEASVRLIAQMLLSYGRFFLTAAFELLVVNRHMKEILSAVNTRLSDPCCRFSQWFKRKKKKKIGPLARNCRWTLRHLASKKRNSGTVNRLTDRNKSLKKTAVDR